MDAGKGKNETGPFPREKAMVWLLGPGQRQTPIPQASFLVPAGAQALSSRSTKMRPSSLSSSSTHTWRIPLSTPFPPKPVTGELALP